MANYNTFNVIDCKSRKCIISTSSARKASRLLEKGKRIDIWNNNELAETIYNGNRHEINKYIRMEKEYIAQKQKRAELRNRHRKAKLKSG